jgi:hypothetical protein
MIRKPFALIAEEDLDSLIKNEVSEGRTIEYKRDLPAENRDARKEFLNDILSFSNSSGGDLIFGVEEISGLPTNLIGVDVTNADELGLRFENICRDSAEPRIQPLQIRSVPLASGRSVVIVRVAQSWQAPHRNKLNGDFTARNSRGKYPMDVSELRSAFINSSALEQRVKQFREERAKVLASELAPRSLVDGIAVALYIVPIESMLGERRLDLNSNSDLISKFRPMGYITGYSWGVNLDGAIVYDESNTAYTQLFRSGQIEAVFVYQDHNPGTKTLYGDFESHVRTAASTYLGELRSLDFSGPVAVMLSIYRAKGSYLHANANPMANIGATITKLDTIHSPDILVQEESNLNERLNELFSIIWNAYGRRRPATYIPR